VSRAAPALAALFVTGLAVLHWQWRIVGSVKLPQAVSSWNQDLYTIYYPCETFAYRSGHFLPLWNPHQLAGTPFLANFHDGLLYPLNLLAVLFPVHHAIAYACVASIALAGLFTLLCARRLGLSFAASLVSAVGYMLNGFFLIEHFRPLYLAGLALVPLIGLAAGNVVVHPGVASGVLLGVALTVQLLTGHAQIVCYEIYALALAVPVYLWTAGRGLARARELLFALAVAVLTALAVGAVQLAPTTALMRGAARDFGGLSFAQSISWTFDPERLRGALFGSGPLVLLALLALTDRRRMPILATAVVLIVTSLMISLATPLYRLFYLLPAVKLFRGQHQMLAIGNFATSILAGLGVDKLVAAGEAADTSARGSRRRLAACAVLLAVVLLMPAFAFPLGIRPPGAQTLFAGALLVVGATMTFLPGPRARDALAWGLVALLVAERLSGPGNTVMVPANNDPEFFSAPPFVAFLREHASDGGRILVIKDWQRRFPIMDKLGTLYGLDVVQDYEPLAPSVYHEFLRPLENVNTDAPLFWGRIYPSSVHPGWKYLDMMATRYVVVAPTVNWPIPEGGPFRLVYDARDARIFENTRALPRAYLARELRFIDDPERALAAIRAPEFDPRRQTIVDRPSREPAPREGVAPADEQLEIAPGIDRVEVRVTAARPGLLVLLDLAWPGWSVTVDGEPRELRVVNYLFRGVAVGAGVHTVRFRYQPLSFRIGVATTLLGLLWTIGALWWSRSRRAA